MQTFKILSPISGVNAEVNDVVSQADFPVGTDFRRLIDLGAIRPVGLLSTSIKPENLQDEIDDLHVKLIKADDAWADLFLEKEGLAAALETANKQLDELRVDLNIAKGETEIARNDCAAYQEALKQLEASLTLSNPDVPTGEPPAVVSEQTAEVKPSKKGK